MGLRDRLSLLFREHAEGLAGAVRGVLGHQADVAEVLQESFLRAWRGLKEEPRDPVAWIFVVTMNTAKDQRRRQRLREPASPLEDLDAMSLTLDAPGPGAGLEQREAAEAARAAIHRLRDTEKEVFLLRVSGDLTFEAIGETLGIPVGTAKSRMRAALANLRARLSTFAPALDRRKEMS